MKGLVLCGGRGTRLRPLTYTIAKQLIPVANRPILGYVFDHLQTAGIKDVGVVVAPETKSAIKEFLGDGAVWNTRVCYILQEEPLGLAHAVKVARGFLADEPFVMYLGDNLLQDGIVEAIKRFHSEEAGALIMLKKVPNPSSFGVASLSETGAITRLVEKPKTPPSDLALVGVYIFSPKIHPVIDTLTPSARGELEITDAIQGLINDGVKVYPLIIDGWWLDTGKKDEIVSANYIVLDTYCERNLAGEVASSSVVGRVTIAPGAVVRNSTIEGPSIIGANAIIEHSLIGPHTSIGPGCIVRHSQVEHSVILENSIIEDVNLLSESLIGREVRVRGKRAKGLKLLLSDSSEVEL